MKKIAVVFVAILSIVFGALAQTSTNVAVSSDGGGGGVHQVHPAVTVVTNAPVNNWSYGAGTILMSRYYGTIFGGTFYEGPMSFTDFEAIHKNQFGNFTMVALVGQKLDRLNKFNRDGGNEYDVGVDQTFALGSKAYPVLVDVGAMYLAVHDLRLIQNDDFDETIRLDFPIRADLADGPLFQPYVQAFHYHTIGDGFQNKGWIGYVGLIRN